MFPNGAPHVTPVWVDYNDIRIDATETLIVDLRETVDLAQQSYESGWTCTKTRTRRWTRELTSASRFDENKL